MKELAQGQVLVGRQKHVVHQAAVGDPGGLDRQAALFIDGAGHLLLLGQAGPAQLVAYHPVPHLLHPLDPQGLALIGFSLGQLRVGLAKLVDGVVVIFAVQGELHQLGDNFFG